MPFQRLGGKMRDFANPDIITKDGGGRVAPKNTHRQAVVPEFPLAYQPGTHEIRITKYFAQRGGIGHVGGSARFPAAFICFTQRSGSNHLAELLASTGKLPLGEEIFNWPYVTKRSESRHLTTFRSYCESECLKRSRDGWFSSKLSSSQLYFLARIRFLPNAFEPRFIFIRRRDLIGQAISYVIARQTGNWNSHLEATKTQQSRPAYDANFIRARAIAIGRENVKFLQFFATFAFPFYEVVYEDLIQNEAGVVSDITQWLGLGPSVIDVSKTELRPQRGRVNDEWRQRYSTDSMAYFSPTTERN